MKRIFWNKVLFFVWFALTIYCIVNRSWWGIIFFIDMVFTHIYINLLIKLEKLKQFRSLLEEIGAELNEKMKQKNGNEKR